MSELNHFNNIASLKLSYELLRESGVSKKALVQLFQGLPDDVQLIGCGDIYEEAVVAMIFRSESFPPVFVGNRAPSFVPTVTVDESGEVSLVSTGLENMYYEAER